MKCKFSRTAGIHAGPSLQKGSDTKTSGNCVAGGRKRRPLFALRRRVIAAAVLLCVLFASSQAHAELGSNQDERVAQELGAMGKHGDTIARAREHVLEILQDGNACSAWFQEVDSDPAEVFRSLHFEIKKDGPSRAYSIRDGSGAQLIKQPWGARSYEYGGRNSTILLNANGAFFSRVSNLLEMGQGGVLIRPASNYMLSVSSYSGNTPEAQITILLHELGHVIGRLPEDDDSWDGQSSRNTSAVSRHCKAETRAAAHNSSRSSD
jgi:hypothetical protein